MPKGYCYVYIVTNPGKTVLYTGISNDLKTRVQQHRENRGKPKTFAGRYYCYKLIYYETHNDVRDAIAREKAIKNMSREMKEALIREQNPNWYVLPV
jgi:putative endonuclease